MDTTLTARAPRTAQQVGPGILESTAAMLGRVRAAIAGGSSSACWQPVSPTPMALLPMREQSRLLDRGLAPTPR